MTTSTIIPADLPQPRTTPGLGHLWRWTTDPVPLLVEGAGTGPVFQLRLWRPAVVGYRPEWNRTVLRDLDTFRSHGSLSGLTPYLAGGVVHTDQPRHDQRRRELNPHFHARALAPLTERLRQVAVAHQPFGRFEALAWSGTVVRRMLNAAVFGGAMDDELLARFLAPLHRRNPAPLLPRPVLFRRLEAAIARVLADPPEATIAAALHRTRGAVEELRVALAAGYDTTAHTLAWAVWHLAAAPRWRDPECLPLVLDEVLRLYPAGWLGSRVTSRDTTAAGVDIPAGTLVLYSPLLTHHDPMLWPEAARFRPDRFQEPHAAWAFLPFSAGRRTCLGAHLARLMLRCALEPLCAGALQRTGGNSRVIAGITLRPLGPLLLRRGR